MQHCDTRTQLVLTIVIALCAADVGDRQAFAQGRRPRSGAPGSSAQLDSRAQELEREYLSGLLEIADQYEAAGEIEKAKQTLRTILRLKPDTESVQEKLDELEDAVFESNMHTIEVDASRGWVATGVRVAKDEPVRVTATGSYRFIVNDTVGPDGFSTQNAMQDMAAGVPSGALMGIIVPPPREGQRQPPEPGEPFAIGEELEFTPELDGTLLLRVNAPPGSKCIGKLRVTISGNIRPA